MNIHERTVRQLKVLAAKGPKHVDAILKSDPKGYIIGIEPEEDGVGASVSLADYDRYSIALQHLEVYNKKVAVMPNNTESHLHQCAKQISKRLTYLEEPIDLLEFDAVDQIAQLRSTPPQHNGDESTYWEVRLWAAPHPHARLTRYRWQAQQQERDPVVYPATFATLGRLVEDLAAGLGAVAEDED